MQARLAAVAGPGAGLSGATPRDVMGLLAGAPALRGTPKPLLEQFAKSARIVGFPPGAAVFAQLDGSADVHVLLSGRVDLLLAFQEPNELVPVQTLEVGDLFGIHAPVLDAPRSCSALARTEAHTLAIEPDIVLQLLEMDHPMGKGFRLSLLRAVLGHQDRCRPPS